MQDQESDVELEHTRPSQLEETVTYTCKLVNPDKRSEYYIKKAHAGTYAKFMTMNEMESFLKENFSELHSGDEQGKLTFGYIIPGHGLKRKQEWITEDGDLENMYEVFLKKKKFSSGVFYPCLKRRTIKGQQNQLIVHQQARKLKMILKQ